MKTVDLGSNLLNFIAQNGYQSGDRLPTISELTEEQYLGISASKVREELEVARALGLVEVRSKIGTRLKEYSFAPAVRLSLFYAIASDNSLFEDFSLLRNHVEISFWHEACAMLTNEEILIMQEAICQARNRLNSSPIHIPNAEHRIFHLTVFQRLENPFVNGLLEAYWDAYEVFAINRYMDYNYLQKVWDYHEQIFQHICQGDFDAAQIAFVEHTKLLHYEPDQAQ